MIERRVFISTTSDKNLDERRKAFKAAILERLVQNKLAPQMFFEAGLPQNMAWNFESIDSVMRKCVGAIVLGFARWKTEEPQARLLGEYSHYEGAVAISCRIPVLLLAESGVANRGIVYTGAGRFITSFPQDATPEWLDSKAFAPRFEAWLKDVGARYDVFLGYCSQNVGAAALIENRLSRAGARVLNYQMDFRSGVSILSEIENAARKCSCGIFLFGNNDPLEGVGEGAAPRDNVVFEAGYFMNAKGADRCLILREENAKMPADIGGAIYLQFQGLNIAPIETRLEKFLSDNL